MADSPCFDRLLGAIYEAPLSPTGWAEAIALVRDAVGGATGALFFHDDARSSARIDIMATQGYSARTLADYRSYYAPLDIRVDAAAAYGPGAVFVDGRDMPFAAVEASEIYKDFYRPLGLAHAIGFTLFRDGDRSGVFSVHRDRQSGCYRPEDIALLERLSPHIIRAVQVQRQMAQAQAVSGGLALALDHFQLAVMLVVAGGRLVHANGAADRLLARPDCPLCIIGGRLQASRPADAAAWLRLIQAVCDGGGHPPGILQLGQAPGPVLSLMASPLRGGTFAEGPAHPSVLLFVADPSAHWVTDAALLMRQFGLSTSEAAVASALCAGHSPEEIASIRRVSRETVRAQIKSTLGKVDVHSQGQLVGAVARSLARLRARGPV